MYCVEQEFSCDQWDDYTVADFAAFALNPSIIGEDGRKCTISPGSPSSACNFYVKYDIDLDATNNWLGLSFQGLPGGSGCCDSVSSCSTLAGAASWLQAEYKEYCCSPPGKFFIIYFTVLGCAGYGFGGPRYTVRKIPRYRYYPVCS